MLGHACVRVIKVLVDTQPGYFNSISKNGIFCEKFARSMSIENNSLKAEHLLILREACSLPNDRHDNTSDCPLYTLKNLFKLFPYTFRQCGHHFDRYPGGGGGGGGGGGALPINGLMGMCRLMGSHFHAWTDYNGVAFSSIFIG